MSETSQGAVVVVGGTRAIGQEIARHYASKGDTVVLTGRDPANVASAVAEVGGSTTGRTFDLAEPDLDRGGARRRRAGPPTRPRGDRPRPEHGRRLRPRQGDPARDPQARRLHRGGPHAPRPADRRRVDRAVRRDGQGAAVPGLDHGHDRQRRGRRPDADARRGAPAAPGQLDPSGGRRRQPVLVREAGGHRQVHLARRRSPGWPRWPRSSTRSCSCSRTPASTASTSSSTAGGTADSPTTRSAAGPADADNQA